MSITNVSDIEITAGQASVDLKCMATSWRERRHYEWRIACSLHFQCCGMKTMQGMDVFTLSPEFQTLEFCRKLRDAIDTQWFRGGNVSFVLNASQRNKLSEMLRNMDRIGAGIKEIPFMNKNMRHLNYLYIWTYLGRKPKKGAIVTNVPVADATMEN